VYALLPWALLAVEVIASGRRRAGGAGLAAAIGLMLLGGHPESTFICGLLVAAYAAWRCFPAGRGAVLAAVAGATAGTAAGAVMLLPFAEALGQGAALDRHSGGGLPLELLRGLVVPLWQGRPDLPFYDPSGPNYFERSTYVGVIPLLLALAGAAAWRAGGTRFFALAALLAGVVAFHVPGLTSFLQGLPVVERAQMVRVLIVLSFCLAMLAGYGVQAIADGDRRARRAAIGLLALALVVPAAIYLADAGSRLWPGTLADTMGLFGNSPKTVEHAHAGSLARWLVFALAGALVLVLALRRAPGARWVAVALVAVVALDVVNFQRGFYPAFEPSTIDAPPAPVIAAREAAGSGRIMAAGESLAPNTPSRFGLRSPLGHGLPEVERAAHLYWVFGGRGEQVQRLTFGEDWRRLAQVYGVRAILAAAPPAELPEGVRPAGPGMLAVDAPPRAFVATAWRSAPDQAGASAALRAGELEDVADWPVIEGAPEGTARGAPAQEARFVHDGDLDVRLAVDAPEGGWLVLLDTYYPGWHAQVDGEDARIHPANVGFRAVRLPPGAREVTFAYRPASVIAGAGISAVAWLALAGLALAAARRRRVRRH
jgi:hypothetical protein